MDRYLLEHFPPLGFRKFPIDEPIQLPLIQGVLLLFAGWILREVGFHAVRRGSAARAGLGLGQLIRPLLRRKMSVHN